MNSTPLKSFEYKGYQFQADVSDNYPMQCKSFILVGYNDQTNTIVYCYFYDGDLDLIAGPDKNALNKMLMFMDDYFYWNDIE